MKNRTYILKITISALCLALCYTLPFLTGQLQQIGNMLCPMHIPVLLCGFICGWGWGLSVGFIAPLFRSLTLTMPILFPAAICMAFELAAYGAFSGLFRKLLPRKKPYIYVSLLSSMVIGRIVWGISMLICTGIKQSPFTFKMFITSAIVNAIPGIIIQIVLIPILVMILENPKVLKLYD